MTQRSQPAGFPPFEIATILRIEGLAVFVAALAAYQFLGGNWWLFALLLLTPDLSMLGALRGEVFGARVYNTIHTYTLPAILGALAWFAGASWLLPYVAIWIAHIGMDRTVGYGLKYPGAYHHTHLGPMGKPGKAQQLANAA